MTDEPVPAPPPENPPSPEALHRAIIKANRDLHTRLLGRPNWNPSHRAKWPETGLRQSEPVNETIDEET